MTGSWVQVNTTCCGPVDSLAQVDAGIKPKKMKTKKVTTTQLILSLGPGWVILLPVADLIPVYSFVSNPG